MTLALHEKQVALVTGASGDIGRAVARRLVRDGFAVALADVREGEARDALRSIGKHHGANFALQVDVTSAASFRACIDRAESELGPLVLLVNNAGIEGDVAPIWDYGEDVFDRVMSVNAKGVFLGMALALPRMTSRGDGCVVNIASTSAIRGRRGLAGYVASKHAVLGLTKVAAIDAQGTGVRVNAVLPGPVEGRMIQSLNEKAGTGVKRAVETPNAIPDDVAASVAFLASTDAHHVNGEALVVDGGSTLI